MKKTAATFISMVLILSMATGCAGSEKERRNRARLNGSPALEDTGDDTVTGDDPQAAIFEFSRNAGAPRTSEEELQKAYSGFVFQLMANCIRNSRGENVMISPESILYTLNLAAAGASGGTLDQMMETMFPGMPEEDAFGFTVNRMNSLTGGAFGTANSVWINKDYADSVFSDYEDFVTRHLGAEVSLIAFDRSAPDIINRWVEEKTDGMITELVDKLDENDFMSLVNAVTFNSDWAQPYTDNNVSKNIFTDTDGNKELVTVLYKELDGYLRGSGASGFIKDYEDDRFSFITILPDDPDTDIYTFMEEMTADDYWEFWNSLDRNQRVRTRMPAFQSEYDVDLVTALKAMGMELPFDQRQADFSYLTDKPTYISSVTHKTYIDVNKEGTKAGASTELRQTQGAGRPDPDIPEVIIDRPYAYAIVDKASGLPVFLGIVAHIDDGIYV